MTRAKVTLLQRNGTPTESEQTANLNGTNLPEFR
jgi:hypothetical protein